MSLSKTLLALMPLASSIGFALIACSGEDTVDPGAADAGDSGRDATSAIDGMSPIDAMPSDGMPPRDGPAMDAGLDGPPMKGVTGVANQIFIKDNGPVNVPFDLTQATIEAFVATGDGGVQRYPGVGTAQGTFSIADVPPGEYLLHFKPQQAPRDTFYTTTAHVLDMSGYFAGRPDVVPAGANTTVTISGTNLEAWNSNASDLQITSSNAGVWAFNLQRSATSGQPADNDTTLTNLVVPWDQAGSPVLVNAAAGDQTYVTELSPQSVDGGAAYASLTRAMSSTTFSIASDAGATLSGAFTTVAQTKTFSSTWKHGDFDALATQVNPGATPAGPHGFTIDAHPWGVNRGSMLVAPGYPDLMIYTSGATGDEPLSLSYGNPYPSSWGEFGGVGASYGTTVAIPLDDGGLAGPLPVGGSIYVIDKVSAIGSTLKPSISPPRNPKIAGRDAFAVQKNVGTSPTISWDAPSVGTATFMLVVIDEVRINGAGNTRFKPGVPTVVIGAIVTRVTLPPGVLVAGHWYVAHISAVSMPNADPLAKPLIASYPTGNADALLNVFTP